MPKRNRTKELRKTTGHLPAAPVESDQARAARLFADSVRQHEAADRAALDRKAAAEQRARDHAELVAAKDAAAREIKRLRENGRPRERMLAAEADYRTALARLTEFETGERPHWAPAEPVMEVGDGVGDDAPPAEVDAEDAPTEE